jgi:hypothetical protein
LPDELRLQLAYSAQQPDDVPVDLDRLGIVVVWPPAQSILDRNALLFDRHHFASSLADPTLPDEEALPPS